MQQVVGNEFLSGHPLLDGIFESWLEQKPFQYTLKGRDLKKYYKVVADTNFHLPASVTATIKKDTEHHYLCVMYPAGGLYAFRQMPFSAEAIQIMQRFANSFHLAYTRYEDLQMAEARARDAVKSASLDRVRGEIASMRTTEDLQRITPLVWNELTTLGVPFIRCGVFIIDETSERVQVYLSTPDGGALAALNMSFAANTLTSQAVEYWRKGKVYQDHWTQEQFINWSKSLVEQGYIPNQSSYRGKAQAPESLHLNFIPFTQGMLYVGNVEALSKKEIDLVQSLAEAFAMAYARYEDFVKIENTLTELKSTQAQLIQSEKMASLGELTAGIAHEIQNPLNFVNNFSQVSNELLEEMKEEIAEGNTEDVEEIIRMLSQNIEKIHHHGGRASSIVKGMLQHSRASKGEKEPTDINALCDEYLRLAYHGVRAKNKSFNVEMKTSFDESIGKINVVPQDIGRVILNLITNAFYAVSEQSKRVDKNFKPRVTVCTRKEDGAMTIEVKDNGTGIPKDKIDKIFQPFFTTKPTGQGTGLGLSLSYDIVKAHGGMIEVISKINEGSKFIIKLPLVTSKN